MFPYTVDNLNDVSGHVETVCLALILMIRLVLIKL